MPRKNQGTRRRRFRQPKNRNHNGNGVIRLGRGSLRFQLSAIVEISRDCCPICGVPIGSDRSWHRHLFGDSYGGPRCPQIQKWLDRRPYRRRHHRPQV